MVEFSFGIIPVRKTDAGVWEILVIQHRNSLHWSFPKGHAEVDETPLETACRELSEETGLSFVKLLTSTPFIEQYHFKFRKKIIFKTVNYFMALVEGSIELQAKEIIDYKWVPLIDAPFHLSYPEAKRISQEVYTFLKDQ